MRWQNNIEEQILGRWEEKRKVGHWEISCRGGWQKRFRFLRTSMPFKSISDSVVECKCPLLPLPIHSTQQPCIFGALWKEEVEGQSGIGKEVKKKLKSENR